MVAVLEIEGATGSWKYKFTKICELKKKLFANLKSLNDYGLIISIQSNKKAYVCVCFIFKIGNATSMRIYFPISMHALVVRGARFSYFGSSRAAFLGAWQGGTTLWCQYHGQVVWRKMKRVRVFCDIHIFIWRAGRSIQIWFLRREREREREKKKKKKTP